LRSSPPHKSINATRSGDELAVSLKKKPRFSRTGSGILAPSEDKARYLRASLAAPPFHHWLRPELRDLDPALGRVTIVLPLRAEFRRDPERPEIHGGVIAALIDIAGHTAIAAHLGHGVPTIDLRIDYLRMAVGSELVAIAEPIKIGRTIGTIDIRVVDNQSKLVAVGRGTFSTRQG
jgi:uncharacterized protein (TIGR00369 family)